MNVRSEQITIKRDRDAMTYSVSGPTSQSPKRLRGAEIAAINVKFCFVSVSLWDTACILRVIIGMD